MASRKTNPQVQVVRIRKPHSKQRPFIESKCKRIVIRAGRRSGKTTGLATRAIRSFLRGKRILYATPTNYQAGAFWSEIKRALLPSVNLGIFKLYERDQFVEVPNTPIRISARTAWNPNDFRGDWADELILDEWQLMSEEVWERVGQPMLLDRNGTAIFLYTPPTLESRAISRAKDKLHAAKLYKMARKNPRWETHHFTSYDNPYISQTAIKQVKEDMTDTVFRMEILAEDLEESPGALWTRKMFETLQQPPNGTHVRVVVAVDPAGSSETGCVGIVVAALGTDGKVYILDDFSVARVTPFKWGMQVIRAYVKYHADVVVGETNFGGDMVESTIRMIDPTVSFKAVTASRGKAVRAQPVSALYQKRRVHHAKRLVDLEEQMVLWEPESGWSPDRLDAMVWAVTELLIGRRWSFTPITVEDL